MKKAYFNWSTGKDSALALYKILQNKEFEVGTLLTNVNGEFGRVSMHGLREELLDKQAELIGIPLQKIHFPGDVTMSLYDEIMKEAMQKILKSDYKHAIFGDIFLEELKAYRDKKLNEVGLVGVYPLWKRDTKGLLKEFLALGFKAITVCVNAKILNESFVGRVIDEQFISDLPEGVDVCGENGEFHTFVYDGPIFSEPVSFEIGEKILRTYKANTDTSDDNCSNFSKDTNEDCYKEKKDQVSWDTGFWYCDLFLKN
ncbi:Dph6-related ATP pyrophosphatase [Flavicella marina]|uniref:Dph6-related ATP pyrophosphatase n=1 Tax=Flavicella marina TaxID=1475951 RepID=UPI001264A7C8|nr:diphthine--ammonia ligase [Flavicella marina]